MKKWLFAFLLLSGCRPETPEQPAPVVVPLEPLPVGLILQGVGEVYGDETAFDGCEALLKVVRDSTRYQENVFLKPTSSSLPHLDSLLALFGKTKNNSVAVKAQFTFKITGRKVSIRCYQRNDTIGEAELISVRALR